MSEEELVAFKPEMAAANVLSAVEAVKDHLKGMTIDDYRVLATARRELGEILTKMMWKAAT